MKEYKISLTCGDENTVYPESFIAKDAEDAINHAIRRLESIKKCIKQYRL